MRDLNLNELEMVYGAGCAGSGDSPMPPACPPSRGSRGKGSKNKNSRGKGSHGRGSGGRGSRGKGSHGRSKSRRCR